MHFWADPLENCQCCQQHLILFFYTNFSLLSLILNASSVIFTELTLLTSDDM